MSDEGEIDVESDEISEVADGTDGINRNGKGGMALDKRAHHNALERKRRDHIKDSFTNLRDCIPAMSGEKVSRAHILNKATEYIRQMQRCSATRTLEIEDLKKKNEILEEQIHALEQAKASGHIDNPEDLIASIAEKVQQRQNMRLQNQQNSKNNPKLQLESSSDGVRGSAENFSLDTPSSSINVLANNIRTTQNLLNALAKNLPTNPSNPQVRSLAARVLASPLRQPTSGGPPSVLPRGVVTATAVPSSFQTNNSVRLPLLQQLGGAALGTPTTQSTLSANAPASPLSNIPVSSVETNPLSLLVSSLPESTDNDSLLDVASTVEQSSKASLEMDVDSLMNAPQLLSSVIDTTTGEEPPATKRVKTSSE